MTSSTGKPMIKARFKEPESGSALFENFILTPDGLWKLQEFCKAVGLDAEGMADADELVAQMPGLDVKVKVIVEQYEGNDTSRIKKYLMG